jgi:cold shock CspA family protein
MGDYLRKCLEMANLPIPAEMQAKEKEEEQDKAAAQPKPEAKAKAAAARTNSAGSGQLAKRALPLASTCAQPHWTGTEATIAMQQPMQMAFPQAQVTTNGMSPCGLGAVPTAAFGAPGYGAMCQISNDPGIAGYGQVCGGVPGDASTAVLQLQYARYAAALQFQTAYAVGGAAMLSNVANAGQPATGAQQMQTLQQNMYSMAAGEPPRRRVADRRPREPHDPERRFIGTITKWDDDAGFGFISSWDAYKVYGKDVFVHKAQIGLIGGASAMYAKRRRSEIRNGDTVSYTVDLAENPGKPRAYNVEKLAAPPEGPNPISGEAELAKRRRLEAERQGL